MKTVRNFLLFSRLHTVIGTVVSITALYCIALSGGGGKAPWHIMHLVLTLIACLGANIYIVGLNQLTDIDIDRINKPYLPLASGAYTVAFARRMVIIAVLPALGIGFYYGGFLLATILISLFLGTIYSLPPFRLKRFYFWAAFCIIAIRGLVVNFLLFLHFNQVLYQSTHFPPIVWMLASTIFVYSVVIAWFKDIPDMKGDRQHKISTLSLTWGAKQVFFWGNLILFFVYVGVIVMAAQHPAYWNAKLLMIAHGVFLLALLYRTQRTVPADSRSMSRYYQFVWALFFLEYIVFAFSA